MIGGLGHSGDRGREQGTERLHLCPFDPTLGAGAGVDIDRHCGSSDDVACFDENQSA